MANNKSEPDPSINQKIRDEIALWISQQSAELPAVVKDALSRYSLLLEGLAGGRKLLSTALAQFRIALGIIPSSEKRKGSGHPIGATAKPGDPRPKDPKEQLELAISRAKELATWHKKLAQSYGRKVKNLADKLTKVEDIELTPEETAQCDKESAEYEARLRLGDGPQAEYEPAKQAFMQGGDVQVEEEFVEAVVDPKLLEGEQVVGRISEQRTRYGFNLTVSEITVEVEKVVVKDAESGTRVISASTRDIGPFKMDVTWEFLANTTIMVALYATPFNRLGSLLTVPNKKFTSGMLAGKFGYVAERLVPVYLHNFRALANGRMLSGDDTHPRVNEFSRYILRQKNDPESTIPPPWKDYSTREIANSTYERQEEPGLGVLLARELGFEFERKDGNGPKKSMQTSLMWGRSEAQDPRSTIVFYRSHIGCFGNLLSMALAARDAQYRDVIIQSDLSPANLISDPLQAARFLALYAGCTSHARRPFAIFENDDPDMCAHMLHLIKGLYIYERGLDLLGRNEFNVRAVRDVDSRHMWDEIQKLAIAMASKWHAKTTLGEAARYITRHFTKLTAYLDNPIISVSNDFSERMLRMENLIEANALFRNSLDGRFALDINRTILQTAIAARAPLQPYLTYVLRARPKDVEEHPENYTALAYVRKFHADANQESDPR